MSFFNFSFLYCSNLLFSSSDFNQNILSIENLKKHNTYDNAWISYNNNIYSIQKNDGFLLNLFKDYLGKDVSEFIQKLNQKEKDFVLERLKDRIIGKIS